MIRSGTANLPLHYGYVPAWLADRMKLMGREVALSIIERHGRDEFLRRISDPFWFQAFGAVMGMDWHSSGITTSVMNALKKGLGPLSRETGLYVLGGRGKSSRRTPEEIMSVSTDRGLDGDELARCSRLAARIDNNCVQDGYQLYLHSFILTEDGEWAVIQQGMNGDAKSARRYHWHSENVKSFVSDPHSAVIGRNEGDIINLSDARGESARGSILDFLSLNPDRQQAEIVKLCGAHELTMPSRHEVRPVDINTKRLGAVLALAHEKNFRDFTDAILLPGAGPRTVQALALVAEVIYGSPSRFSDPARFSFAHGGKDGHPCPVPLDVYDRSLSILRDAVKCSKTGNREKLEALEKLGRMTEYIEKNYDPESDVDRLIAHERRISGEHGGRTVFDDIQKDRQLKLF